MSFPVYGDFHLDSFQSTVEWRSVMSRSETALSHDVHVRSTLPAEFRLALMRYFSRRLSERSEVEDLVQDALTRLLCGASLDSIVNWRSYVFQAAQSVLVDWLRKRGSRRAREHDVFDPEVHGGEDFAADRILSGRQELTRAIALLYELPEPTRAVFVLHKLEGMRYAQIAARLHVSVSTVEKRMYAALRHLMDGMERGRSGG